MKTITRLVIAAATTVMITVTSPAQEASPKATDVGTGRTMMKAADLKWADAPEALPKGAKLAVLQGDPMSGAFTVRLKVPAGYKIPLHTHPNDEVITVISGNVKFGMSDSSAAGEKVGPGGFAVMPAGMQHSASATSASVLQVSSDGPFVINYVNPSDDPRQAK